MTGWIRKAPPRPDGESLPLRKGEFALVYDREKTSFPECLVNRGAGPFIVSAVQITSVLAHTFRGRLTVGGARLLNRRDVIATRPTLDEIRQLYDHLCAIGRTTHGDLKAAEIRIVENALADVDRALAGGVAP